MRSGQATVALDLDIGEHTIRIEDDVTGNQFKAYATVRTYATWHAAYAEVLESLDLDIEQIYEGTHLEQSISMYLDEFWGREVGQTNNLLYATETFRGVLWNLRQAYRWSGATKHGLQQAVWAFTSSSPWIVPRPWRARWILDTPLLPNFALESYTRTLAPSTDPAVLPDDDLPSANESVYQFVHRQYDATAPNLFPGPIFQPPVSQVLTVTFPNAWDGGDITIEGTTTTGDPISEVFPVPAPLVADTVVIGTQVFTSVTSITKATVAVAAVSATVGLAVSRFAKIVELGSTFNVNMAVVPYGITWAYSAPSVHAGVAANAPNLFPGPITQPPTPSALQVGFALGWDGGDVIVAGVDGGGAALTETFPSTPRSVVLGEKAFAVVSTITKTVIGVTANTAAVGLPEDLQVRANPGGLSIPVPTSGTYTIESASIDNPVIEAVNVETYALTDPFPASGVEGQRDHLYLDIDGRGVIGINIHAGGGSPITARTAADIAADINNALNADPRYGAAYAAVASAATCSVDGVLVPLLGTVVSLRSPSITAARDGYLSIVPGPYGAAGIIFPYPRSLTTVAPAPDNGYLYPIGCIDLARFPLVDDRIEPGPAPEFSITGTTSTASFAYTGAALLDSLDVGRYIRIYGEFGVIDQANVGTHEITSVATNGLSCTLLHERAATGGVFVTEAPTPAVQWAKVYYNLSSAGRIGRGIRFYDPAPGGNGVLATSAAISDFTDALNAQFSPLDVGGWVRIVDAAVLTNDGIHQIISYTSNTTVTLLHQDAGTGGIFTAGTIDEYSIWTEGEKVEVVEVDRVANELLVRELVGPNPGPGAVWPTPVTVPWGVFAESGDSPTHRVEEVSGLGPITLEVDRTAGLTPPTAAFDPLDPQGSSIPDGWETSAGIDQSLCTISHGQFTESALVLVGDGSADMVFITPSCPRVLDVRGRVIQVSFWVQQHMLTPNATFTVEMSFDGKTTWPISTTDTITPTVIDVFTTSTVVSPMAVDPQLITVTGEVPWDATDFHARISWDGLGAPPAECFSVHRAMVTVDAGNGVFLGSGTVPRSALQVAFGEVLYAWSPQDLTVSENNAIGLPSGVAGDPINTANNTKDHIDQIVEAHGYWERFDPTTYDGAGNAENLRGAYKDTEWTNATMFNMELVTESPSRLSYLRPTRVSAVTGEALAVTGPGPGTAVLANRSTHRGNPEGSWVSPEQLPNTGSALGPAGQTLEYPTRLYKDGVPIEDTAAPGAYVWRFSDASNIGIFNPPLLPVSDAWTIDYQVEMSVYTDVIDIGTLPSDYVWLVDAAVWLRRETLKTPRQVSQEIQFLGDNTATLNIRSNQDKLTGVLSADNGNVISQVDESNWSYVSSNQISIEPAAFSPDSIYTLTYTGVTGDPTPQAEIVLEWRSNATNNPGDFSTLGAVPAPAWTVVEEGFVVDRTVRYHQFRLTVYDVSDVRDIRVYGLGLRGVNLYGSPPSAPGILLP